MSKTIEIRKADEYTVEYKETVVKTKIVPYELGDLKSKKEALIRAKKQTEASLAMIKQKIIDMGDEIEAVQVRIDEAIALGIKDRPKKRRQR